MVQICPFCREKISPEDRLTVMVAAIKAHAGCFMEHLERRKPIRIHQPHKKGEEDEKG